ncbi:MAG: T9SS type A sorting domain-containing protein [Jejuia sp.]
MKKITQLLLKSFCMLCCSGALVLNAQQTVTWSVVTLADGTEVSTDGTLVEALNFGGGDDSDAYDVTVNTVPFEGLASGMASGNAFANPTATYFSANSQNVVPATVDQYDPVAPGIAVYDELLSRFLWNAAGAATVTLSNLTVGQVYKLQFFMGDKRSSQEFSWIEIGVTGGTSFGSASTTNYAFGPGQVINGDFTAVGTSFTIDIRKDQGGSDSFNVNAYQLRNVTNLSTEDNILGSFKMYPNPAKNRLNINLDQVLGNTKVSITSVTGQVIHSEAISKVNTEINISSLKSGLYLVQVESDNASVTKKLIVE